MATLRFPLAFAAALGLSASLLLTAGPAAADPPPWAEAHGHYKHKQKHKQHRHDDDVVYVPVPVYQYQAVRPMPARRGAPYGFDRGTCDRGLLSAELMGNVLGGAAGGLAGSQIGKGKGNTAAIIGGTIMGVLVGGAVGQTMDTVDHGCVEGALDYAPDHRQIRWNGDRGYDYAVMPVRSWETGNGRYCREYQTTATVGGRRQATYGTACRQPDGQWEIVD